MVKTGLSAVIGSWKIKPISAPRTRRISGSDSASRSRPLKRDAGRQLSVPARCTSRMIDIAVTDLPLPDSPTRPSVSPAAISKLTSIHRRGGATGQVEDGGQVADREDRFGG